MLCFTCALFTHSFFSTQFFFYVIFLHMINFFSHFTYDSFIFMWFFDDFFIFSAFYFHVICVFFVIQNSFVFTDDFFPQMINLSVIFTSTFHLWFTRFMDFTVIFIHDLLYLYSHAIFIQVSVFTCDFFTWFIYFQMCPPTHVNNIWSNTWKYLIFKGDLLYFYILSALHVDVFFRHLEIFRHIPEKI